MSEYWIGVDLGSSSVKSLALSPAGGVIARGRAALPGGAMAERPVRDWTDATRQAIAALGLAPEYALGLGLSGLTPSVVLVDETATPVRDALTWMDSRASAEAAHLAGSLGTRTTDLIGTELPWGPGYPPAQLLWLSRNESSSISRTRHVLTVKDYVGLAMTGSGLSDPWSSKGVNRVDTGSAAIEVLEACGWESHVAPATSAPWSTRGTVTADASQEFGLAVGLPVAVGWSDALCAMLALGVFDAATGFALTGTSNIAGASLTAGVGRSGMLSVHPPIVPLSLCYGPTQNGGSVLEWLSRVTGRDISTLLDDSLRTDGEVPVFVPYLDGERAPIWRGDVRGAMQGLSSTTGPAELAAASLRAIVCTWRSVIEATGALPEVLRVGGPGVSHPAWRAAVEDVFPGSVAFVDEELSSLGAAMLAARAHGAAVSLQPAGQWASVESSGRTRSGPDTLYTEWSRLQSESLDRTGPTP